MSKYKCIIWDLDGTLLNTEIINEKIIHRIISECNKDPSKLTRDVRESVIGVSQSKHSEIIINAMQLPITIEEYNERWERYCQEVMSDAEYTIGADELTEYFYNHNIRQCLATSSIPESVKKKMERHSEMMKRFECMATGDEVKNGKPAPDIFLKAAEKMKVSPNECIVFEDSVNGIKGAKAAGMIAIAIPGEIHNLSLFTDADEILNTLNDFKPEKYGFPQR